MNLDFVFHKHTTPQCFQQYSGKLMNSSHSARMYGTIFRQQSPFPLTDGNNVTGIEFKLNFCTNCMYSKIKAISINVILLQL